MTDKPTVAVLVVINAEDLVGRPFDLRKAEEDGVLRFLDPSDEERSMKDVELRWQPGGKVRWPVFLRVYAAPVLAMPGSTLQFVLTSGEGDAPAVRGGANMNHASATLTPWLRVDRDRLGGEAGAKLQRIRAILDGQEGG